MYESGKEAENQRNFDSSEAYLIAPRTQIA
jgi:hypothetical protein